MLSPENACFRTEAHPWKTFELCFKLLKWFPLQYQPLCAYLKIHANVIYNIYNKHICLQPSFQSFYEQEA